MIVRRKVEVPTVHFCGFRLVHWVCTAVLASVCALSVRAQYEGTTWEQRLGKGRDSVNNYQYVVEWYDYLGRQGNSRLAVEHPQNAQHPNAFDEYPRTWDAKSYKAWKMLQRHAPFSSYSLFEPGAAGDMLRYLLYKEADPAIRLTYFFDLMEMSDFRIAHLTTLNRLLQVDSIKGIHPRTLGDVMAWKAHYYFTEGKLISPKVYDKVLARRYFAEAMEAVRQQDKVSAQTEIEPYLIEEYFTACCDLFDTDQDKYRIQFLQDYQECAQTCRRLYESSNEIADKEAAEQHFNRYFNEYNDYIKRIYTHSGVGAPAELDAYFKAKFEENKGNIDYVNTAIRLMMQNNCVPVVDEVRCIERYATVASAHREQWNYYSALAYALTLNADLSRGTVGDEAGQDRLKAELHGALDAAYRFASDNQERAAISFQLGKALYQPLDTAFHSMPDELYNEELGRWIKDLTGAVDYLKKAVEYDADHYGVAAHYLMCELYRTVYREHLTSKYQRANKEQGTVNILADIKEYANKCIAHHNEVVRAFDKAIEGHFYEQDNRHIREYLAYAQNYALNAKNFLEQNKHVQTRTVVKRVTTKVDPRWEAWHRNTWHKKLKSDAFWHGTQRCQYCGATFK